MPQIESEEKLEKAIKAVHEYDHALKLVHKAQEVVAIKLGALKTITGITSNDAQKIREEVLSMLGHVQLYGLPDQRG